MFCWDTGTFEQKEQLLEAVLEQWGPRQGSSCHVATSQRRDVPHVATSQRHDIESTMQKSTNRNVVTSQRRDVSTSRRLNVATSQRRDVSTSRRQLEICTLSFKVRMAQKSRGVVGRHTNKGTEFQSRVTQTSRECPGFVLFLIVGYFVWILG